MLTYLFVLLMAVMAVAGVVQLNRRVRLRKFREFAATVNRTLQLETCSGISATHLYEYLYALATALRTQAMLRSLELRPGEFEQVMSDAIESAHLLKRDAANKDVSRGALQLFAACMDAIMSSTPSAGVSVGDEANFVGTAGGVTLLASAEWHAESNADLVTCALTECAPAKGMADYWRAADQAHRERVESAFERVVRTALDPATAGYVRHKVFAEVQEHT